MDRRLSWLIARGLRRWTNLDTRDYAALLHLAERYAVGEIAIREDDWLAGRRLDDVGLRDEGVVILGMTLADGTWVGAPTSETRIEAGDRVVAYGPGAQLGELDRRLAGPDGDSEHEEAVERHRRAVREVAADRTD